ncbi:MAG: hypothetical protein AUJ48_04420 [Deltaproteobacteria bacterium CG1_02_45_11]|nr:MAG: hypothetical protein AUJ48_04420 [Deltaproteobacteria bacterium CG1_02_45_11]
MGKKEKQSLINNKPSLQLKRREIAGWLSVFFFVAAGMFVLGGFVGRGTAPVQFDIENLQKELAALKEAVIKKELTRFKIDVNAANDKTDLGFYEELKETKDNDEESRPPDTPKQQNGSGNLIIQVASLKDLEIADEMVAKLIKKGYPAYRIIVNIPGKGSWYRVRIGPYTNESKAVSVLEGLKKDNAKPILIKQ